MRTRIVAFTDLTVDDVEVPIESGHLTLIQNEVDTSDLTGPSKVDGTRSWYADVTLADPVDFEGGAATFGTDEGPAIGEVLVASRSVGRSSRMRLQGTGPLTGLEWA